MVTLDHNYSSDYTFYNLRRTDNTMNVYKRVKRLKNFYEKIQERLYVYQKYKYTNLEFKKTKNKKKR